MTQTFPLPLSADELMAEARRVTGVDMIDEKAAIALPILVDSYNREGGFTQEGAKGKQRMILRFLKSRLYMLRDYAAHPEIHDIELLPPVIINALARTGSTKMQKTLAATGDFNWLPYWMVVNSGSVTGVPNEDVAPRIADMEEHVRWFDAASPDAKYGHSLETMEPEEDSFILMQSLYSITLNGFANAPSYVEWLFTQGFAEQFLYLRDTLKYLIWQGLADADKPFVLKSAMTYGFEEEMLQAFPNAHFVMTHRNPLSCIPSGCRLGELYRKAYSDVKPIQHMVPDFVMANVAGQLAFRKANPDKEILDIDYRRLRDDAADIVREIYEFADMELGPQTLENVRKWEDGNPKNKLGKYEYSLEQFGFSEDMLREKFAPYLAFVKSKGIEWP